MQREILFRGKRADNGKWVEGSLIVTVLNTYIVPFHDDTIISQRAYSVIPETVGQFTGLHDKNGNKVFEGDYDDNFDVVAWCDKRQGWAMKAYDFPTDDFMLCHCYQCEGNFEINDIDMSLEIIGNIHDKPEPL
jgi:uncharacterized phage protein (TIGR01671 family)